MPTAGRLIGALTFAVLGAYLAFETVPLFEEGKSPGFWYPLCMLAGVWAGWTIVGRRAGQGYSSSVGLSLTGVAAQSFWVLFLLSGYEMIGKSMRRSYDGPVEAVINVFEIGGEYAIRFATIEVITVLIAGALMAGMFTEFFARRYP